MEEEIESVEDEEEEEVEEKPKKTPAPKKTSPSKSSSPSKRPTRVVIRQVRAFLQFPLHAESGVASPC